MQSKLKQIEIKSIRGREKQKIKIPIKIEVNLSCHKCSKNYDFGCSYVPNNKPFDGRFTHDVKILCKCGEPLAEIEKKSKATSKLTVL